jgi:hypothetical protein
MMQFAEPLPKRRMVRHYAPELERGHESSQPAASRTVRQGPLGTLVTTLD